MKPGSPLSDVVRRVDLLADQARDFVAPARNIRMAIMDQASSIVLDDGTGALTYGMTDPVHDQLSTLTGSPSGVLSTHADGADHTVTKMLVAASRIVDILLVDRLMIGDGGRFSSIRRLSPEVFLS